MILLRKCCFITKSAEDHSRKRNKSSRVSSIRIAWDYWKILKTRKFRFVLIWWIIKFHALNQYAKKSYLLNLVVPSTDPAWNILQHLFKIFLHSHTLLTFAGSLNSFKFNHLMLGGKKWWWYLLKQTCDF